MIFNGSWRKWKVWITAGLVTLLAADIALAVVLIDAARQAPQSLRSQAHALGLKSQLIRADVARGKSIQNSLSQAGLESAAFYKSAFLDSSTGYSTISADLNSMAAKAGLQTQSIDFTQKELKGRSITEISISETVMGDYPAVIEFINALERSRNFYLLRSLTLDSATTGGIKLKLDLATYFRNDPKNSHE